MTESDWDATTTEVGPDLRIGEYRGFRAWTMRRPDSPLRSLSWEFDWQDGVNEAKCLRARGWRTDDEAVARCQATHPDTPVHLTTCFKEEWHTKPTAGCGCGFWAYFDRKFWSPGESRVMVFGVVRGWGSCRVGSHGFRSQFAQIEALALAAPEKELQTLDYWRHDEWAMPTVSNLMRRYPSAEVYPDVDMMLGRHHLSAGRHD